MFSDHICQRIHQRTVNDIKKYRSHPQSVAIDYLNNDNLLDFVVVNTDLDSIDIFLGQNNGTFQHHATYSTGSYSQPCSVAVGNLDYQSGIDTAVANFDTNSIVIFMGSDNGFFTFNQSVSTGSSRPLMIALADLNEDHWLDLVVLNYGTDSIGLYIASKDGFFVFLMNYRTGYDSLPKSLAIADLNNDNQLDIVVANFGTNNVGIFFGNGNGTFADQKIYSTGIGSNPSSVVVGDVDHDENLDLIVANYGAECISIFFGERDESFTRHVIYSTGSDSHPEFVAVYDFNGDDRLDILAIDSLNERAYILPGNENNTIPLLSVYLTDIGSIPISMVGADFNNDNSTDVLIVNRGTNELLLLMEFDIQLSASYKTFTADTIYRPASAATNDVNGDNLLDMVVVNDGNNWINVFLGSGNGNFTLFAVMSTKISSTISDIELCDFNSDQQLEIAVANSDNDSFSILFGYGNGTFSVPTTHSTNIVISPIALATADINNDGCSDIVIVGYKSDNIGIYGGNCNATFKMISIYQLRAGWGPYMIMIDDLNNDNSMDLVITYTKYNSITVYFGDGTGRFLASPMNLTTNSEMWDMFALGDFNKDNRTDVVVSENTVNRITIFFGYGNGNFVRGGTYPLGACYDGAWIAVDDFNDDNQLDVSVSCPSANNVVMLFGNNDGEFWSRTTYSTGVNSYPHLLMSGDFNNDEKTDLAVVDYLGNKFGIFTSYYKADFTIQNKYSTGSSPQPYSIAVADFNNDSISDIVVVYSGTKNIGIQLGFGNGSFGTVIKYPTGSNSFVQHVSVGDLNKDGQVDIVIADSNSDSVHILLGVGDGTFGRIMTYFMGLQSSPIWVEIVSLGSDDWLDLVVTNEGINTLNILYGYNYATFVLHRTYSTGDQSDVVMASVADINHDNRLDIIVTNFRSNSVSLFFGDGNGSFTRGKKRILDPRILWILLDRSDSFGSFRILWILLDPFGFQDPKESAFPPRLIVRILTYV